MRCKELSRFVTALFCWYWMVGILRNAAIVRIVRMEIRQGTRRNEMIDRIDRMEIRPGTRRNEMINRIDGTEI